MEHLSAFLPMEQRQALARGETLPVRGHGSALFADISGSSPSAIPNAASPKTGKISSGVWATAVWSTNRSTARTMRHPHHRGA